MSDLILRAAISVIVGEKLQESETVVAAGLTALHLYEKKMIAPEDQELSDLIRLAALRRCQARSEGQTIAGKKRQAELMQAVEALGEAVLEHVNGMRRAS